MPITRRRRANPPEQPENNNNHHVAANQENAAVNPEQPAEAQEEAQEKERGQLPEATPQEQEPPYQPYQPNLNGERTIRPDYSSSIEGGRRTARGELFRRPPQSPQQSPQPTTPPPVALQPPSHEIKLPLGTRPGDTTGDPLHLAYNPGYTGSDEARSALIHKLAAEAKAGGRARCWNCGSLAITYECWNTRNKTFGEIGIAFCEICGVWSVL
jgi:hypothetical protein